MKTRFIRILSLTLALLLCSAILPASAESAAEKADPETLIRKKLRLPCSDLREAGAARHVFTHQIWQMTIYKADAEASASAPDGYTFVPLDQLAKLPLPAAMNAAVKLLMPSA